MAKTPAKAPTEPTDPPAADPAAVMDPPPADPVKAPAAPAAPKTVEITVSGQKFTVTPEAAALYEAQNKAFAAEIATLTAAPPAPAPAPDADPAQPNYSDLLLDNPDEFVKQVSEKIREDVVGEVSGRYDADQNLRDFWRDFYAEHEDLASQKDIVEGILSANFAAWSKLTVPEARAKLADTTRSQIVEIVKKFGPKPKKGDRTATEPAGGASPASPSDSPSADDGGDDSDTKVTSLSDVIRQRKTSRRQKGAA